MQDFWPDSGFTALLRTPRGWLQPTDGYWRGFLAMPELALVDESGPAETALHEALLVEPSRTVGAAELAAVEDEDARANYTMFLGFRDTLLAAGTLEAWYLALMRSGQVALPPVFIDRVVLDIVRGLLDGSSNAFEARAAELLFRPQRLALTEGRMLAADRAVMDLLHETAGLGDIGRLLVQNKAPLAAIELQVLNADNADRYWEASGRRTFVLDMTHEVSNDLGHGLRFTMTRADSGLKALASVLVRWVAHFLGVAVTITPLQRVVDASWRWHIGLDVEASAMLDDLYQDRPVDDDRLQRFVSLFRLDFASPDDMRTDVAGKPVYLGLAMTTDGVLKLKPQNLLLNLPLAAAM
ncbi:hypothetical protein BH11PSE8_BH11PSE8_16380 [soil metagenome]